MTNARKPKKLFTLAEQKGEHTEKSLSKFRVFLVVVILGSGLKPCPSITVSLLYVIPLCGRMLPQSQGNFYFYNIVDRLTKPCGLER